MSSEHQPPKTKAEDVVYAVVRAGVGSVPIVGAAASELLGLLAAPPLERRRDEWMKNVTVDALNTVGAAYRGRFWKKPFQYSVAQIAHWLI